MQYITVQCTCHSVEADADALQYMSHMYTAAVGPEVHDKLGFYDSDYFLGQCTNHNYFWDSVVRPPAPVTWC